MSIKTNILVLLCCVPLLWGCGGHEGQEEGGYTGPPAIQLQLFDSKYFAIAAHYKLPYVSFAGAQLPKCKDYLP